MPIDPVVILAEELRIAESTLRTASERRPGEAQTGLMARVVSVYKELVETVPTSALGAAELIFVAAGSLPSAGDAYASHLRSIADRLMSGQRLQADLIWLRAAAQKLAQDLHGESGTSSASILHLAIRGAARPIIVYRAVDLTPEDSQKETGTG